MNMFPIRFSKTKTKKEIKYYFSTTGEDEMELSLLNQTFAEDVLDKDRF